MRHWTKAIWYLSDFLTHSPVTYKSSRKLNQIFSWECSQTVVLTNEFTWTFIISGLYNNLNTQQNYLLVATFIPEVFLQACTNARKKQQKKNSLVSGQGPIFSICPFPPVAVLPSLGAKVAAFSNKNGACHFQAGTVIGGECPITTSRQRNTR